MHFLTKLSNIKTILYVTEAMSFVHVNGLLSLELEVTVNMLAHASIMKNNIEKN